jgi:hypothetical protein
VQELTAGGADDLIFDDLIDLGAAGLGFPADVAAKRINAARDELAPLAIWSGPPISFPCYVRALQRVTGLCGFRHRAVCQTASNP